MWAAIATVFVYRETNRQSMGAAVSRASATLFSFVLCLIYLLLFPFSPLGLAILIGFGTFVLMAVGRDEDVVTAGITVVVVMVVAGISPHHAWEQPILRLVDTAIGIAVGITASIVAGRFAKQLNGHGGLGEQSLANESQGAEHRESLGKTPLAMLSSPGGLVDP
jgi:uncharacterized membrane protein YgaE (UPF0421/DUF939 family)